MNASEVIRNLRKSRNITQEQLAEAICVERSSIGKYETGTLPSVDVLIRIADYFDVSVDYILNDTVITPSAFSKRLKDLRNKRKLSQNDIADILNVKSNTISQYENGRREPDFSSLCRIADYFGVTTDYLLGIEDTPDIVLPLRTLFGDQLKKYRSMANLSQSTLAKLLNVSRQAVGSWETNRTSPSPEMIVEIASVLNVSTDTLLGVASDSESGKNTDTIFYDESHGAQAIKMERLIELRKQQNLTQQDTAHILGISRQAYSNYELGNREADYATLKKLADHFRVSIDYLLAHESETINKDEPDISHRFDEVLSDLGKDHSALMFDSEPLDDESRELLSSLTQSFRQMVRYLLKHK